MIDREHEWVCTDCGAKFEKQPSMCNTCGAETFALLQKEYDAFGNLEEPVEEEVIEEVVVEAPEEELCEECGEDPCACEEEEEVDYSSMKVSELKQLLKIKGFKTTGKKADLIERLEG